MITGEYKFPTFRECAVAFVITILYISQTALWIGLRPEHLLMAVLFWVLFLASNYTRKLAIALLPFIVFGVSYDWMRLCPNYTVNPIDVRGIHDLELSLFGMHDGNQLVIPWAYIFHHHISIVDFMSALFYLYWV